MIRHEITMGRPGRQLLEAGGDGANNRLNLRRKMRAGPLKSVHHPLQIGHLVLLRVAPRCGHVALIEDRQGPGDATSSRGCFAALKKDLPERRPGGLLLEERVKAAQIVYRSSDSEAFFPGLCIS